MAAAKGSFETTYHNVARERYGFLRSQAGGGSKRFREADRIGALGDRTARHPAGQAQTLKTAGFSGCPFIESAWLARDGARERAEEDATESSISARANRSG